MRWCLVSMEVLESREHREVECREGRNAILVTRTGGKGQRGAQSGTGRCLQQAGG